MTTGHRVARMLTVLALLPAGALGASALGTSALTASALAARAKPETTAPTRAQRAAILHAFGAPKAAWSCLAVRLAASNHRYGAVRFRRARRCQRWAFNGGNVLAQGPHGRWRVVFEGSSYRCPLPRIPLRVQRDLRVCPLPA